MYPLPQDDASQAGLQGSEGIPSGNYSKKLEESSRIDSHLENSDTGGSEIHCKPSTEQEINNGYFPMPKSYEALKQNEVPSYDDEIDKSELNSYKFPKPRVYNPNRFQSDSEMNTAELLSNISTLVGPKEYMEFLEETLKKSIKPKKAKPITLNNIEEEDTSLH
jgi:hypothetical protein